MRESHPEVFFKSLQPDAVLKSKNSVEGLQDRRRILEEFGNTAVIDSFSAKKATKDDLLDAMVLSLGKKFQLKSLPSKLGSDSRGLKMQILKPIYNSDR